MKQQECHDHRTNSVARTDSRNLPLPVAAAAIYVVLHKLRQTGAPSPLQAL